MFGYVTVNKPELKLREFARYRGFYCGLCRRLQKKYGRTGQMTLTYDMTFLILLLSSLYEPETKEERRRCLVHPAKKHYVLYNEITDYAADMNILLSYEHLRDDWEDERKLIGWIGMKAFVRRKKKVAAKYPRQSEAVSQALEKLRELERQNSTDIDAAARPFGELMAELFLWREDAFRDILRPLGFYLGKFIYCMDAWMDREDDARKNCYNPFLDKAGTEYPDGKIRELLDGTLRMAIAEFEKLPCEQDLAILRNILYEGVWTISERKKNDDERSL